MTLHRFLVAIALFGLTTACAQDIADIDRTYPNKVHKSMFNGTWYFRGTVTEVAPDMAGVFEGVATGMSKLRWYITESELRGWSTTETVIGMDQEIDDCRRVTTVQADGRINIEETFNDECDNFDVNYTENEYLTDREQIQAMDDALLESLDRFEECIKAKTSARKINKTRPDFLLVLSLIHI